MQTFEGMIADTIPARTHLFSHLGNPPYGFIRFEILPGRGGSCDHCGTAIKEAFFLRSQDGKTFKVGNQCVYKTGDRGLKKETDKIKLALRHAREDARSQELIALLLVPDIIARLEALPHPCGLNHLNAYQWANWMLSHAGRSGKMKVYRFVSKMPALRPEVVIDQEGAR